MNSNVECVVLSSCNSAYSENGIISDYSLTYAFHNSGVKYVVSAFGALDDETTTELLRYFYQNIAKGQELHWALTNAKREYLLSNCLIHPFFWSPLRIFI